MKLNYKVVVLRYLKPFISIIIAAIVLYYILALTLNSTAESVFENKLTQAMGKQGLRIEHTTEQFNLISRKILITGITLKKDSVIKGTLSEQIDSISVDTLAIKIQSWLPLLMESSLRFSNLKLVNPVVVASLNAKKQQNNTVKAKKKRKLKISVKKLEVINSFVTLYKNNEVFASIAQANFAISGLKLNLGKQRKNKIPISYNSIEFTATNLFTENKKQLTKISLGAIAINSAQKSVKLTNIAITPTKKNYQIAPHFGYRKAYSKLRVKEVLLSGIDLVNIDELLELIHLEKLKISGLESTSYIDKRFPKKSNKVKRFYDMVFAVPQKFAVDTILIHNAKINHKERIPDNKSLARLYIPKVNIELLYLSNDTDYLASTPPFRISTSGKLDKHAYFSANISMPLLSGNCKSSFKGKLTGTKLGALNGYTEPAVGVRFKSGFVKKMHFNILGSQNTASCELLMEYTDLKLEVLKKSNNTKTRKTLSFLANRIIKTDNPKGNRKLQPVIAEVVMAEDECIREMWVKSLVAALKQTIVPIAPTDKKKRGE